MNEPSTCDPCTWHSAQETAVHRSPPSGHPRPPKKTHRKFLMLHHFPNSTVRLLLPRASFSRQRRLVLSWLFCLGDWVGHPPRPHSDRILPLRSHWELSAFHLHSCTLRIHFRCRHLPFLCEDCRSEPRWAYLNSTVSYQNCLWFSKYKQLVGHFWQMTDSRKVYCEGCNSRHFSCLACPCASRAVAPSAYDYQRARWAPNSWRRSCQGFPSRSTCGSPYTWGKKVRTGWAYKADSNIHCSMNGRMVAF